MVAMEDKVIGSLYKTTIFQSYYQRPRQFFKLFSPFAFSVSKINHILNLFLILIWLTFFVKFMIEELNRFYFRGWIIYDLLLLITILCVTGLYYFGRTGVKTFLEKENKKEDSDVSNDKTKKEDYIKFQKRGLKEAQSKIKKI